MECKKRQTNMQCKVCRKFFQLNEEYVIDHYTNVYHVACSRYVNGIIGSAPYRGKVLRFEQYKPQNWSARLLKIYRYDVKDAQKEMVCEQPSSYKDHISLLKKKE